MQHTFVATDVSGQSMTPIFKGTFWTVGRLKMEQSGCPETSVAK